MANENLYKIKRGEKFPILFRVRNTDEDKPIDLTNATIKFQLKDELKDDFYILQKNITTQTDVYSEGRISDPEKGEFIIRFTSDDFSKLIDNRVYYMTLWWEVESEDFAKVISSNGCNYFKFIVCTP